MMSLPQIVLTLGAAAISGVLVIDGLWTVWDEGFNTDASLRLALGIIACVVAILFTFSL